MVIPNYKPVTLFFRKYRRISVSLLFEKRDLWVGVYWDKNSMYSSHPLVMSIYVCIIPTLPICIQTWVK